ncbi:MAG: hypothetical protein LH606_10050 [Cytophagaceae bacterium]|nr:hypothetical protein [Cytophagaceae bacterium]
MFAMILRNITNNGERSDWPDLVKNESHSLWSEASKLSELRNTIAHNPLVFGSTAEGIPAWGIVNIKKMKGPGPFSVELIDLQSIISVAIRAGEITNKYRNFSDWRKFSVA